MMDPSNFENVVNNEVIIEDEGEPITILQVGALGSRCLWKYVLLDNEIDSYAYLTQLN